MVMVVMMMVAANIIGFGGRAAAGSSGIHTVDDTEENLGGLCIYLFIDVSRNFSPTLHCLYFVQSNNRFNIVRSIYFLPQNRNYEKF